MSFQKIYGLYGPNYPADIFTPSCLDPHWPAGHLRSKHISYSWYDGKSSYDGTPSYDDFPSYENFLFGIWWIAIILTIQCMMELHHIMMLIHHKLYDSYKLYYCHTNINLETPIVQSWKHFAWWWPLALLLPHCSRMHLWCSCVQEAFCNLLSPHSYSLLTSTVATVAILMELSSPNYLGTHRVVLPFPRNFPHPRFLSPYLPQHLLTFNIFRARQFSLAAATFKNDKWQLASIALAWKIFEQGQ